MEKRGVLTNEGQEVEVVVGPFKGKSGIVKESRDGSMKVEIDGQIHSLSEGSCRTKTAQ